MLLIFIGLLVLYHKWRTVKFYWNLYITRYTGRERSSTQTFSVDAGIAHSVVKLGDIMESDTDQQIESKSYTIDISFENLGLTLKKVRFIFFVSRERVEYQPIEDLGLVQTSNFSCAEPNANELKQRT